MCNSVANAFGLPGLYVGGAEKASHDHTAPPAPGEDAEEAIDIGTDAEVADPFHISIGWTLAEPSNALSVTDDSEENKHALEELHKLRVPVNGVKAKVGNMITHIPLEKDARQYDEDKGRKRWLGQ